ncbi:MAG: hypothetical protein JXQ67_09720 [Campylobacterales bacterium]|nr:hypothetical protein [Campylobacterales bacterium]
MSSKEDLINDIQNLLNTYEGIHKTAINPALLEFMDEGTLKNIIGSLLDQKEQLQDSNIQWLEQFKSNKE